MTTFPRQFGIRFQIPQWLRRALVTVTGLGTGVLLLALFVFYQQTPERLEAPVAPISVTVIEARPVSFQLEARGHGVTGSVETWQAVANVAGRVMERHPSLQSGAMLHEGTLLLALDPSRYELTIAEAQAEIAGLEAENRELDTEEANAQRLLEIERERLTLAERELSRIERLAEREAASEAEVDAQAHATYAQRQSVVSLENTLTLIPARREVLQAQRDRAETRLAQAKRDLEDTRFVAPYDLRLGEVEVELHQFVSAGQRLFQADNIAAAELEARIPISMMQRLVGAVVPEEPPEASLDLSEWIDFSAIAVEVEVVGVADAVWTGRVTGIASGLDPTTRAARVLVQVDQPYRDARPPERPPLQRGVYTRVRLLVPSPEPLLVVPSAAVHHGEIFLIDDEERLERRAVEVAFEQRDLAVIAAGLGPGERVVIDDLPFAVDGMALAPRRDQAAERQIAATAQGTEP